MPVPDNISVVNPWNNLEKSPQIKDEADHLTTRLKAELPPGHVLQGLTLRVVARRIDRDDVLVEIEGSGSPLAVVHLTWHKDTDPRWPTTKFYQSWEHWAQEAMIPAHDEYERP